MAVALSLVAPLTSSVRAQPVEGLVWDEAYYFGFPEMDSLSPDVGLDSQGTAQVNWASTGESGEVQFAEISRGGVDTDYAVVAETGFFSSAYSRVEVALNGYALAYWLGYDEATRTEGVKAAIRRPRAPYGDMQSLQDPSQDVLIGDIEGAMSSSGYAVLVWGRETPDGSQLVEGAVAAPDGGFSAPEVLSTGEDANNPEVAIDSAGNAVAVWEVSASSDAAIYYAAAPAGDAFGAAQILHEAEGTFTMTPDVVASEQGRTLAVWADDGGAGTRIEASFGSTTGGFGDVVGVSGGSESASEPAAAIDFYGNTGVMWLSTEADQTVRAAYAPSATRAFGKAFELGALRGGFHFSHELALAKGTAVGVWQVRDEFGSDDVEGRGFNAAGPVGEALVLDHLTRDARAPRIAASEASRTLGSGRALVVMEEFDPEAGRWRVFATGTLLPDSRGVDPPSPIPPVVSSFEPDRGRPGDTVTIKGTGFEGATEVAFSGRPAPFEVVSDSEITAIVPEGAATGTISVTTPDGTGTSSGAFTVLGGCKTVVPVEFLGELLDLASACWRREGLKFIAVSEVSVAGLGIVPVAGAEIVVDVQNGLLTSRGRAKVRFGGVTVWEDQISWELEIPDLTFRIDPAAELLGFDLTGQISLRAVDQETLGANVFLQLPETLGSVTVAVDLQANEAEGLLLNDLDFKIPVARLGGLMELRGVQVTYSRATDRWQGQGKVVLPGANRLAVDIRVVFEQGEFVSGSINVDGLNQPISPAVFLQRLSAGVSTTPLQISGGIGLSAGPRVGGQDAARLDGDVVVTFSQPFAYRVEASLTLVEVEVASAYFDYIGGNISFGGQGGYSDEYLTIQGRVDGWIVKSQFNIEGAVQVRVLDLVNAAGRVIGSSKGIAACVGLATDGSSFWSIGAGHTWNGPTTVMATYCDVGPWRAVRPARGGRAIGSSDGQVQLGTRATQTFDVPAGLPGVAFEVVGTDAPPKVILRGPNGEVVETSDEGQENEIVDGRAVALRDPSTKTTYLAYGGPSAGEWTIEPKEGSSPLLTVNHAYGLDRPDVSASVTGAGATRTLTWRAKELGPRTITFVEQLADGSAAVIAETTEGSGTVRFTPTGGETGERRVVALLSQDGVPGDEIEVATFLPPADTRLPAPRGLNLAREGSRLVATWKAVAGATRYETTVKLSDGRKLFFSKQGRRVKVSGLGKTTRAVVKVQGVAPDGELGRVATKKLP